MKTTRRDLLKGTVGSAVIAAGAMVATPLLKAQAHPDAQVFALIEQRRTAAGLAQAAEDRWYDAVQEALPPHLRNLGFRDLSREDRAIFYGVLERPDHSALHDKAQGLKDECKAVAGRLAEAPAQTLDGIHAKLQGAIKVGYRGRYLDRNIALSAVDDLARLVGEARS